jgi:uncharacterized protein (TIRG00374 family)
VEASAPYRLHNRSVHSLQAFWDAVTAFANGIASVGVGALALALAFHSANLLLRATAWRNILAAAAPGVRVRWRSIAGAYFAGIGLNSVVPARGGDVMKVYLAHRSLPGTATTTIASSLLAETAFDAVIGSVLIVAALSAGVLPLGTDILSRLDAFEWSLFAEHARAFLLVLAVVLIGTGIFLGWIEHHVTRFWERVRYGLAIMRDPRRYLREVVAYQAAGWACRGVAMYFFLQAFRIPAGLWDAALALSASSVATLMPVTPGGIGPQQALFVYMFDGVASRSAVLSFSVGMQLTVTLANALVGGVCIAVMLRRLPWKTGAPPGAQPAPTPVDR